MIFKSKRLSLSVAESCTAGLISHMLTLLPGASEFFDSSIICYSSESKQRLLNIKEAQIKKHGTVSEETAIAMAEMVRKKTGADVSLSITGNLGPVPIENRKAGLVFIAVSFNRGTESKGMIFDGSRNEIKQSASVAALEFLYEVVSVWT
ncbi:MAG: CinA family protein [Nitrospirae bacterium]|nr:CinA family protein [Nitrospirota bacterium]